MKVKEILTLLLKCDPEDEVFMLQYDNGDTMDIAGIRTVTEATMPYDRNGFVESYVSQHGKAVIISDYWPNLPWKEFQELCEDIKQNPSKYTWIVFDPIEGVSHKIGEKTNETQNLAG